MKTNRINDSKVEREIAKFLDSRLYSDKGLFKSFARTDGIKEQINGSDVVLSTSDGVLDSVVVDEKVASRYANIGISTFSLELSFLGRDGKRKCGWFTDTSKSTEYYLLGWITSCDIPFNEETKRYDTDSITCDKIKELQWCLVSRKSILRFLEERGWTLEKLGRQDDKIRSNGGIKTKDFINDISFRYSTTYGEKPINILLKKETYLKLSHLNGIIKVEEDKKELDANDGKITLTSRIENDKFTEYVFGNYDIQNREETITEVPIPSREDIKALNDIPWNIFLICGRSGSGKSTILSTLGGVTPICYDYDKAIISQFPNYNEDEACELLQSVGLSSVPTWLRRPQELSNGEKARLDLCKAIYEAEMRKKDIIIDEFTSVVNRDVAKSMSFALQRYIRQKGLKIIIASCHFDIIEWLQPDMIFNLNHKDESGRVEIERMVYSDDSDYKVHQGIHDYEALTEAIEI